MGGYFLSNNNIEFFLASNKVAGSFMTIGFAIIWLFIFGTDLVLLMVLFILMNVKNRSCMLKRIGLLKTNNVKGVKDFSNHYFNHRLHLHYLVAIAAAHKPNTLYWI